MTEWYERIAHSFSFPPTGKIVYFNGVSSSGKTTVAKGLRERLLENSQLFMYLSADDFYAMLTDTSSTQELLRNIDIEAELPKIFYSFNQVIPGITRGGNNLIVDNVFHSAFWGRQAVAPIKDEDVLFVGVFCSDEVNDAREEARESRAPGLAAFQRKETHTNCHYDVEIDTSAETTAESVQKLLSAMEEWNKQHFPFTGIKNTWENMQD
jgi:chloramphenicol 3-O phosphotransferase